MNRRRLLLRHEYNKYIHFEDKEVERICIEKRDKDGDGKLSKEEAAQVEFLGNLTLPKDANFAELQYFTGLKQITYQNRIFLSGRAGRVIIPGQINTTGVDGINIVFDDRGYNHSRLEVVALGEIRNMQYIGITNKKEEFVPFLTIVLPNTPTPPEFSTYWCGPYAKRNTMYVPNSSVELYKAANVPGVLNILPMSEYKGNY
mgnify:FL=1